MSRGFVHPFTCVIAGPSKSGKTIFLKKLLKTLHLYVYPCPQRIIWCYGVENKEQMKSLRRCSRRIPIEFFHGLPPSNFVDSMSSKERSLIVLDDLMREVGKDSEMSSLFTRQSHHKNLSVIFIIQNLFHQNRGMRDIRTSTDYWIICKNPTDKGQIQVMGRQIFPNWKKYLSTSFELATFRPYGYIVIDMTQEPNEEMRVTTGIFPPEVFFHFLPVNKK